MHRMGAQVHELGASEPMHMHPLATPLLLDYQNPPFLESSPGPDVKPMINLLILTLQNSLNLLEILFCTPEMCITIIRLISV